MRNGPEYSKTTNKPRKIQAVQNTGQHHKGLLVRGDGARGGKLNSNVSMVYSFCP